MRSTKDFTIIGDSTLDRYRGTSENVVIPDGVTKIGAYAFNGLENLVSVTIPDSVTSIGKNAFLGCNSLAFNTYDNAEYLENAGNPHYCLIRAKDTSIKSCKIHDDTIIIADGAFARCMSLKEISIPNGVTSIGDEAFYVCSDLESIVIPDSVTTIGVAAFSSCGKMEIKCSEKTARLWDKYVFWRGGEYDFEIWSAFVLQDKIPLLPEVKKKAIAEIITKSRRTKTIPALIEENRAELLTLLLSHWKKPDLDELDSYIDFASRRNNAQVSTTLLDFKKNYFTEERQDAYHTAEMEKSLGLRELSVADWRKIFKIVIAAGTVSINGYKGTDAELVIPEHIGNNTVTEIGERAFSRNKELSSVTIPNGVVSIGNNAFRSCTALKNVMIPGSVTVICDEAFRACETISEITIPEGVVMIGQNAFYGCSSLTSVTIPSSVTSIGIKAFANCPKLTIQAPADSYAEKYAKKNKIPFKAI